MRNKQVLLSGRAVTTNAANVPADRYSFLHLSDAEPNLGTATANDYVLVYNTHANSTGNRIWSSQLILAYANANGAFAAANAAFANANGAFVQANSAYQSQNATGQYANAAFTVANGAFFHANAAFANANGAFAKSNAAFLQANTPSYTANSAAVYANASFDVANSASVYANSAYRHANGAFTVANAGILQANSAFNHANGAYQSQNATGQYANASFVHANAAFAFANTISGGSAIDNIARTSANSAGIYANTAFIHANAAFANVNTYVTYNEAVSVTQNNSITSTFGHANAAFIRANNSLDANNGGTVTGDVRITGNLTVTGNTTYVNTTQVLIGDNIITLNAAINQASAPMVDAGIEVDRGSSANVYLLWNETIDKWTVTNNGTDYYGLASDAAESYANSAFIQANASFTHANAAYVSQNATGQYANAAFSVANGAFFHANAAFANANGAFAKSNAAYNQANSAFIRANNSLDANNGGTVTGNVIVVGNITSNTLTTTGSNGSISGANAIFTNYIFAANGNVDLFIYSSNAYANANGAFAAANAAFANANGAFAKSNAAFANANSYITYNEAVNVTQNNSIAASFVHANAGFANSNNYITYAEAVSVTQNNSVASAFFQANAAFANANSYITYNEAVSVTQNNSITASFFHANAAFAFANTLSSGLGNVNVTLQVSNDKINAAFFHANSAYQSQNASGNVANSGFSHANAAFNAANNATDTFVRAHANAAYNQANSGFGHANAAFIQANSNYISAVTRLSVTNSGASAYLLDQYSGNNPTIYVRAGETIAFNLNVSGHPFMIRLSSGGANYDTGLIHVATDGTVSTTSSAQGKVSGTLYWKVPFDIVGSTYVYQCSAHGGMVGNIVIEQPTTVALNRANAAFIHANAAFNAANNATDTYVRNHANAAFFHANGAFVAANSSGVYANASFTAANSAGVYANGAFGVANSAGVYANGAFAAANNAYIQANAAFIRANNSLDANNGGTVSGDVRITGNLTVTGNTTYVNTSQVLIGDNIITLNAAINQASAPMVDAGIEVDRGNAANVYLLWNETEDRWTFTNDGSAYEGVGFSSTAPYANSAFTVANGAFLHANAAFTAANSAGVYANASFIVANAGILQANAAFFHANSAYQSQNATGQYANAAFIRANNSLDANVGGIVTGNVTVTQNLTVTGNISVSGNLFTSIPANGNTSAYATKYLVEYNPVSREFSYSSTPNASNPYITGYSSEIHVSPVAFNDSGKGTIGDPVKTIARAKELLALAFETTGAGQRKTIILHPGDYVEDVTIDTQFTVLTSHELIGKSTTLTGTLTLATGCTIDGLKMTNLVISATAATGAVDLIGCTVTTSVTKTSSAYTVFRGCDLSSATLSVTGAGNTILIGGNYGSLTVNNASAGVLAKAVITMGPTTLTAGTLQIADTIVYSATNSSNAITQSAGSVLTLNNSQILIPTLTNVARVNLGGFYSILHSVYDKANSTLSGTSLNAISYSQYINADKVTLSSGGSLVFPDSTIQITAAAPYVYSNAAFIHANAAFASANNIDAINITQNNSISAAFLHANSGYQSQNATGQYANSAFANANGAFAKSNASYDHANAAFIYANTATGAVVTYGTEPPASGNSNGHIWIDSTDGTEYMYFKDVDGFQWVEFGPSSSNVSTNTFITGNVTAQFSQANAAYDKANAAFDKANSSITSDRLSSNLAINIIRVLETANIYSTAVGGNVNIDVSNNTSYFFSSNTTANVTFNLRANGNAGGIYDSLVNIGQASTVAIALKQGSTRYKANLYIDGVLQTLYWLGNSAPDYATTQPQAIDVYSFVVFKTAANAYSVLAANSNFGLAQGQPGQG